MVYSFNSRIRYSETDSKSNLTFPALLDYFQDTSTFHGEDNGLPLDFLYEKNLTWILGSWQVRIFKTAKLGDNVTSSTWAYNFNHCLGYRHYSLSDENGEYFAIADTQYVLMDFEKMTPVEIESFFVDGYTLEPDSHINLKLPRKIRPVKEEEKLEPVAVQPHMIDTNNHVNNSQYIKTAMAFLPEDFSFNCFRCEYKKQAHLGDVFYPSRSKTDNGIQIKIYDADGSLFFIAEWTTDNNQSGDQYVKDR